MQAEIKIASLKYNLEKSEWKLIKSFINQIYDCGDKILQLTPKNYKRKEELELETNLIEYLNQNSFEVVKVVKSREQRHVEETENFYIICYEKIIGSKANRSNWNEKYFKKLGLYTGKLHELCKTFEDQSRLKIKEWDQLSKSQFREYLPKDERNLSGLHDQLLEKFSSYNKEKENYGLIHYDIHHGNYILRESTERIVLYDFEMTCKSWYINEISTILYYILNSVPFRYREAINSKFVKSFIRGYREERTIEESEIEKIPLFLFYRDLLVYGFTFRIWKDKTTMNESSMKFREKLKKSIEIRRKRIKI